MTQITKLVLPVAGVGKRLRPLTLKKPKALVAVNGQPLLDYILEEARESGFREVLLVISPQHRAHFAAHLKSRKRKFKKLTFTIRIQKQAFGNGQAILSFADLIEKGPFGVRFCDDLLFHREPALAALLRLFHNHRRPLFILERVPQSLIHRYGVVAVRRKRGPSLYSVKAVLEKPKGEEMRNLDGATNLAIVGGYILTPRILRHLQDTLSLAPPLDDALPLTVAFHHELAHGGEIYGWEFPGVRLDCGTLEGLKSAEAYLRKTNH